MNDFGALLRSFRQKCTDPNRSNRVLSQERFGELLGMELGMRVGYSGAAISDWERGKSKINADQRKVLISLIMVLYRCGGIKTITDANGLLEVGNYRALNRNELEKIRFHKVRDLPSKEPDPIPLSIQRVSLFLLERTFSISSHELQNLISDAREGPKPFWPRILVSLIRRSTDHLSASAMIRPVIWVWIWLITRWLISPSLDWPFTDNESAWVAIMLYAGGSIVIPLAVGVLTDTKHDKFWREHKLAEAVVTRLYTYQGAGIGFHLGYFGVFSMNLLRHYINLKPVSWFELSSTAFIITLGYAGARLVPYNLWRAYGQLDLNDGKAFFIFIFVGPLFGFFFYEYYEVLLTSVGGGLTILFTITLAIFIVAWQHYLKNLPKDNTSST